MTVIPLRIGGRRAGQTAAAEARARAAIAAGIRVVEWGAGGGFELSIGEDDQLVRKPLPSTISGRAGWVSIGDPRRDWFFQEWRGPRGEATRWRPDTGLVRTEDLARARGEPAAQLERTIIVIDPPGGSWPATCGIVVAGRAGGRTFILADRSVERATPTYWARAVVEAAVEFDVNDMVLNGSIAAEFVRAALAAAGARLRARVRFDGRSLRARAEPVAMLYEAGRVVHCGEFPLLEEELLSIGQAGANRWPDRAAALVTAIEDLGGFR